MLKQPSTEGRELPLSKPLSRRAERVLIAVVAATVVAGTALIFLVGRGNQTGLGWLFGGVGGAMLGALIWAHLSGGIDKHARAQGEPEARPATATVAATYPLASVRARMVAGLIDQALSFLPVLLLILMRDQELVPQPVHIGLVVLGFALFLLGAPFSLWLTNGGTPGRKLLGIRVVRTDGMRMTLRRALRRELGGAGYELLLAIPLMRMDDLRRTQADRRARTVVVMDAT